MRLGISIHALLAESDNRSSRLVSDDSDFYPRSPCGERLFLLSLAPALRGISIHALLAESDGFGAAAGPAACNFYPRSPCGERPVEQEIAILTIAFLSTLSLRRATETLIILPEKFDNFYPRSPCGERRSTTLTFPGFGMISIHALLAESDGPGPARLASCFNFYPRSPCGERQ